MLATPRRAVVIEPPKPVEQEPAPAAVASAPSAASASVAPSVSSSTPAAEQDNAPPPDAAAEATLAKVAPSEAATVPAPSPEPAESVPVRPAPLFRARQDIPRAVPASIPAVIPIIRAPDDPGVDEDGAPDEFADQIGPPKAQAGGWREFLSRWGGN